MNGKRIAALIAVLLVAAFIWGNSMLSKSASLQESELVRGWVAPLLKLAFGKRRISLILIRKLAHLTEFAALGVGLGVLFAGRRRWYLRTLGLGMAAAVLDETIQLFSDRSAELRDVGIDMLGILLGTLLCAAVLALRRRRKNKRTKAPEA